MKYPNLISKMLCVTLIAILSCSKESEKLFETKEIRNSGVLARNLKEGYDFNDSKITPIWEGAIYLQRFVETPYVFEGKLPRPTAKKGDKTIQGREKLLISTQGSEFKMFIVRYLPSPSFKGDINKINSQNFKEQKFDGVITIKRVGEEDFETWKVRNGKVVKQTFVTNSRNSKNKRSNNGFICEQWAQDTHWFQKISGEWVYTHTTTEYGQDCEQVGDGDGGGDFNCGANPGHPLCDGSSGGSGGRSFNDYMNDPTYADFYNKLNEAEKAWFKLHPERIPAAHLNKKEAEFRAENKYYEGNGDNTNANAYKHALYSGLNTKSWGASAARELGIAHEATPSSENMRFMDLYNNDMGIAKALGSNGDNDQLSNDILNAIANGEGRRLEGGVTNGSVIPTDGTGRR